MRGGVLTWVVMVTSCVVKLQATWVDTPQEALSLAERLSSDISSSVGERIKRAKPPQSRKPVNCNAQFNRNLPECLQPPPPSDPQPQTRKPVNCNPKMNRNLPECLQSQPPSAGVTQLAQSIPWIYDLAQGDDVVLSGLPNTPRGFTERYQLGIGKPNLAYQSCRTPRQQPGVCRYLQHCILPEFANSFSAYLKYACFIEGRYLGACCPTGNVGELVTSTPAPTPRPTTAASDTRGCGMIASSKGMTRIVGGQPADPREWPWIAALLRSGDAHFCGGALITKTHVLTAAHCVKPFSASDITVRLGEYTFNVNNDSAHSDFKVRSAKVHEGYDDVTYHNDIAIITLERSTEFTADIWPVCLPAGDETYNGQIGTVIGWGTIYFGGPTSPTLMEVTVPVWTNSECIAAYPTRNISETQLCAGGKEGGKDSCQGDSGGPFLVQNAVDKRWILAGVVSYGLRCAEAQYPGVYTRVSKQLTWIRQNTA